MAKFNFIVNEKVPDDILLIAGEKAFDGTLSESQRAKYMGKIINLNYDKIIEEFAMAVGLPKRLINGNRGSYYGK